MTSADEDPEDETEIPEGMPPLPEGPAELSLTEKIESKVDQILETAKTEAGDTLTPELQAKLKSQLIRLVRQERYSGPIPHPIHLAQYEKVLPGLADRIVAMAERQLDGNFELSKKSQDLEEQELQVQRDLTKLGLNYGLIFSALLAAGGIGSAAFHETAMGLAFIGAGALGTVTSFINGYRSNSRGNGKGDPSTDEET